MNAVSLYANDWTWAESYGRIAHELADGLEKLGLYVNRFGPGAPTKQPIRMSFGGIGLGYPTNISYFSPLFDLGPRIWVTAFESTRLPWAWADILNESNAAIVPSRWLVDTFKKEGVTIPVHCIPQGVSSTFKYVERVRSADDPFTVLVIADRGHRKAFDRACFAFMRAFGEDPSYRLIIKARENFPLTFANKNAVTRAVDLTDAQMLDLYQEADCMIFPGREGFGLPPREFAATGGTALALNWGGTADDLPQWGLPIAVEKMEPAWREHPRFEGLGEWATADIDDIAATLKHIAKNRDYYRERGRLVSTFASQTYDWANYASQVLKVWQEAAASHELLRQQLPSAV